MVLDDGHYTAEEILVDQPDRFGYMVSGYTGYRGLMIDHAIGDFRYADEGGKTRLEWTYSFRPRFALVRPFLSNFVNGTWADLMRRTLTAMREGGERDAAKPVRRARSHP